MKSASASSKLWMYMECSARTDGSAVVANSQFSPALNTIAAQRVQDYKSSPWSPLDTGIKYNARAYHGEGKISNIIVRVRIAHRYHRSASEVRGDMKTDDEVQV
ncbi:uncharacterized protein RHO25_000882 [Cercospora beticola]|uniref:Uncharacterized protein n=1 Tax=Cercospora beticola TaxID=122368 RepID=A0ABZ0N9S2_CERBT|nr:hypothetical protein RHO25_000882 [Cercospora beticola]